MILVIDSGGTKLEWRSIDDQGAINQGRTAGFHPLFHDDEAIIRIAGEIREQLGAIPQSIHYYGTGYASEEHRERIAGAFEKSFEGADMEIQSDLLAVARALCGHDKGIACILGTGSNSCYYDGQAMAKHIPPLGYILGDEGSGAALGKKLLQAYCRGRLPEGVSEAFKKRFPLSLDDIFRAVYQEDQPNKFLAGFARFALHHQADPTVFQMIQGNFQDFIDQHISRYPEVREVPVHFSGSIAFYFNGILREVLNQSGVTVGHIVESPIAGLTLYHKENNA